MLMFKLTKYQCQRYYTTRPALTPQAVNPQFKRTGPKISRPIMDAVLRTRAPPLPLWAANNPVRYADWWTEVPNMQREEVERRPRRNSGDHSLVLIAQLHCVADEQLSSAQAHFDRHKRLGVERVAARNSPPQPCSASSVNPGFGAIHARQSGWLDAEPRANVLPARLVWA